MRGGGVILMLFLCQVVDWKRDKKILLVNPPKICEILLLALCHLSPPLDKKMTDRFPRRIASWLLPHGPGWSWTGHSIFMKIEAFALLFHQFLLKRIIIKHLAYLKIVFFSYSFCNLIRFVKYIILNLKQLFSHQNRSFFLGINLSQT